MHSMVEITLSQSKNYRPNQVYSLEFIRPVDFGQPGERQQAPWVSSEKLRIDGRESPGRPADAKAVCSLQLCGFLLPTQLLAQGWTGKAGLGSSASNSSDVNWSEVYHVSWDV